MYDATPYVDHILDLFEERSDRLIIAREVMDALNVTLNDPGASAKSHMVLFNLFDEHKCSYILKWRLLELRAKRREDNGQTHLMIKALLALIDRCITISLALGAALCYGAYVLCWKNNFCLKIFLIGKFFVRKIFA